MGAMAASIGMAASRRNPGRGGLPGMRGGSPRADRAGHQVALARHPGERVARRGPAPRQPVVEGDEFLAPVPYPEADPMDGRVGETPEGMGFVRQEVGGDERILARPDALATQGAVRPPGRYPVRGRRLTPAPSGPAAPA